MCCGLSITTTFHGLPNSASVFTADTWAITKTLEEIKKKLHLIHWFCRLTFVFPSFTLYATWTSIGRKEMFYLTTHSTHFIYGYMASHIWLRTILIVRKETRCRHIGYSYRLTARVLLYAPSHRQESTYHGLCYTSCGALAGTRNSSMGPPHEGSIQRPIAPWANALWTSIDTKVFFLLKLLPLGTLFCWVPIHIGIRGNSSQGWCTL